MNSKTNISTVLSRRPASVSLKKWLPFAAGGLLLACAPLAVANPCSYGELFNFSTNTAGVMTDIDRQPVSVGVTTDGSMSTITAGAVGVWGNGNESVSNPALDSTADYGSGLFFYNPTNGDTMNQMVNFAFSKSMRNLVMSFNSGTNREDDNTPGRSRIFTFTDAAGNAIPIGIRSYLQLTPSLTSGAVFDKISSNQLQATGGSGTIQFLVPVTTVKVKVSLPAGQTTSPNTQYGVNFGQFCDDIGLLGPCENPRVAEWAPGLSAANGGATTANGRVATADGEIIPVTYTASKPNTASNGVVVPMGDPILLDASNDSAGTWLGMPYQWKPIELVSYANPKTGDVTQTFEFGKPVSMPSLISKSSETGTYSFFKADGVTPLPFIMRHPSDPDNNRQIDSNVLYAPGHSVFNLQFTETTKAIVVKIANSGTGFASQMGVYLNCTGIPTGATSQAGKDTDGDGVPDTVDKCPNTPAGAVVGADGCPLPTDLSITKTASVTKITPGDQFKYIITVTNTGAQAQNVKASDIVPAGLNIIGAEATDAGTVTQSGANSKTVEALWPIVGSGETRKLIITVVKP